MTGAPHPLRCETCQRRDQNGYGWCSLANSHVNPPNTVSIIAEFTKRCGCASHSSTTTSAEVLEELLDFIDNADNHFKAESGFDREEQVVTIHKLVDWIVSKGVIPNAR